MANHKPQAAMPHEEGGAASEKDYRYCSMPTMPAPALPPDINPHRARAILDNMYKWVNGTVIHYFFFNQESDSTSVYQNGVKKRLSWVGDEEQRQVVRDAFGEWKKLGIGLEFEEVENREDAEVRIGFMPGDGSWSYIGTYALEIGPGERTVNIGWNITQGGHNGIDTAIHEIGHALGLPHEHQNPYAGIVWDEEAVYAALAKPPNSWSRDKTYHNIIRKIPADKVQGSNWDPDSIMHYPFEKGLIKEPGKYANGLTPKGGLSERDMAWIRSFYPALDREDLRELHPSRSEPLAIRNGEQQNFVIRPDATRYYDIRTFGTCDTLMVLFKDENGDLRYRTADDDSGEDRNASLRVKLTKGARYVLRVRLKYTDQASPPAVMMW